MYTLFVILTIFCAVLLIGIVLIQKSKGGGLSSSFASSNQVMGVRRTNDFIEKMTWYLAGAIAVFSILSSYTMPDSNGSKARTSNPSTHQNVTQPNYDGNAPTGGNAATTTAEPFQSSENPNAGASENQGAVENPVAAENPAAAEGAN